jgi:hypothetical protein
MKMYFRASDIIKFLDFETPVAPMVVWLRQAERNGLVKRATDVCGYTIFKFRWFKKKKIDKNTHILLLSGDHDLFTKKGLTTKILDKYLKMKKFKNVETMILEGRHELLFEKNKYQIVDEIISWLTGENVSYAENENAAVEIVSVQTEDKVVKEQPTVEVIDTEVLGDVENEDVTDVTYSTEHKDTFMEAEEDLLIKTNKESE